MLLIVLAVVALAYGVGLWLVVGLCKNAARGDRAMLGQVRSDADDRARLTA
jgi:hypothetical protein